MYERLWVQKAEDCDQNLRGQRQHRRTLARPWIPFNIAQLEAQAPILQETLLQKYGLQGTRFVGRICQWRLCSKAVSESRPPKSGSSRSFFDNCSNWAQSQAQALSGVDATTIHQVFLLLHCSTLMETRSRRAGMANSTRSRSTKKAAATSQAPVARGMESLYIERFVVELSTFRTQETPIAVVVAHPSVRGEGQVHAARTGADRE